MESSGKMDDNKLASEEYVFKDNEQQPLDTTSIFKKKKGRHKGVSNKKTALKCPSSSLPKRKKRGINDVSDVEEDLASTPPPSPSFDSVDIDSSLMKRRSARNTQRKKYVDDVLLRFSDEDSTSQLALRKSEAFLKSVTEVASVQPTVVTEDSQSDNVPSQPKNIVYVNDDDSMVVQFVLNSRMNVREIRKKIQNDTIKDEKSSQKVVDVKENVDGGDNVDNVKNVDCDSKESKDEVSGVQKDGEINDDPEPDLDDDDDDDDDDEDDDANYETVKVKLKV